MPSEDTRKTNALIHSRSPYLLQHAHNPVDWLEWGDAAFEKAAAEDKPIFLSIGYSTCHWCHVMARESFEDERIAAYLNENFVSVKLDREERPDVDRIYMSFVQTLTGSGGWPLSVWLLPDGKPFYGGTYFPPDNRYGRIGFYELLTRIQDIWTNRRGEITEQATKYLETLDGASTEPGSTDFVKEGVGVVVQAVGELKASFDLEWGGFGLAPKFPMAANLRFLLEVADGRVGDKSLREDVVRMLRVTLSKMAQGGIYDHLGGGFHRYSVDRYWHVPHYEKMLYDQAQLLVVYALASRLLPVGEAKTLVGEIVAYLKRDMMSSEGGLFAAEDADSEPAGKPGEHAEGAFYVWTDEELKTQLNEREYLFFRDAYSIRKTGNSPPESDPHNELVGKNTLLRSYSNEALAEKFSISVVEVENSLRGARRKLFEMRNGRPRPHLDDKIVTGWNAMAVSGLCKAYQIFGDEGALEMALSTGRFIRSALYDEEQKLLYRVYRGSRGLIGGFAEDYASMVQASIDLYESTFDVEWLRFADELANQLIARFEDREKGGFFASEEGDDRLIARLKDDYDGAEPCSSSIATLALLKLGSILDEPKYSDVVDRTLKAFQYQWGNAPRAMSLMLVGLLRRAESGQEIVVVGDPSSEEFSEAKKIVYQQRGSGSVVIALDSRAGTTSDWLLEKNQLLESKVIPEIKLAVYLCKNYVCEAPVRDIETLKSKLGIDALQQSF